MKTSLIILTMLIALPVLSQDAQKATDSSRLDLETLQYVESEFRKCDRIKAQTVKDGLTIARLQSGINKLQAAVSAYEIKDGLRQQSSELTRIQLDAEKKKKPSGWKIALWILTAGLAGYGAGSM